MACIAIVLRRIVSSPQARSSKNQAYLLDGSRSKGGWGGSDKVLLPTVLPIMPLMLIMPW